MDNHISLIKKIGQRIESKERSKKQNKILHINGKER